MSGRLFHKRTPMKQGGDGAVSVEFDGELIGGPRLVLNPDKLGGPA